MTDIDPVAVFFCIADEQATAEAARLGPHACASAAALRHAADPHAHVAPTVGAGTAPARSEAAAVTENDPHAFRRLGVSAGLRPAFSHDCDRILHSRAYTRYIDKTQVFSMFENDNVTHRVLHVQFVARVARSIARALRLNEDLAEAISLGHDLGHAPFGHEGESYLHALAVENRLGTFRHAAQSVRTLTTLEAGGQGLNLSLQTLDGILAHNGELLTQEYRPRYDKTWRDLDADLHRCFTEPDHGRTLVPMTLEGCVMRISDVIAYIGRDVEDAIQLGVIARDDLPGDVVAVLGRTNEEIIDTLVSDLVLRSRDRDHLAFGPRVFAALRQLMQFNYECIYLDPRVRRESAKIERMFRMLFAAFVDDLARGDEASPVARFRADLTASYRDNTAPGRVVIDFIAGMTDDYFNHMFRQRFVPQRYGYHVDDIQSMY